MIKIRSNVCPPEHAANMWIMSKILQGMRDGVIPDDPGTKYLLMDKICTMRGTFAGVGDKLSGKIPLAYAHFVQVLVDVFLAIAPFALYRDLGMWSVFAVGVLSVFYNGMLDLAKILLDPLDNTDQKFYEGSSVNMDVGVLIRESNAGSNRWKGGLEELPFAYSP
jgi:predicted membrane chloride channel (bestrophin family)